MSLLADRLRSSLRDQPDEQAPLIHPDIAADPASLIPAAVLVPIIDAPRPRLLLTVRHADLRAHAGQVAFPGGRLDPEDNGPIDGALREAWEEIGLPPDRVEIAGTARPHGILSGYMITPVIGVVPEGLPLVPHEAEVAGIFEAPLDHILDEANHLRRSMSRDGIQRSYIEIDWPDERIWGVTAGLIVALAPRLRAVIGQMA